MRFKQYIAELFKTDIHLERSFSRKKKKDYSTRFKIEKVTYYFQAEYYVGELSNMIPDHEGYYTVVFGVAHAPEELRGKLQGSFELTGLGNAPRVLAGVMKSFKGFIKERNPHVFKYESEHERGRVGIYDKFAKMIKKTYKYQYVMQSGTDVVWVFWRNISEALVISDEHGKKETRKLKFTKRNIEKIASHYDAKVQKIETDIKHATLKDNRGRLLFVDEKVGRLTEEKLPKNLDPTGFMHTMIHYAVNKNKFNTWHKMFKKYFKFFDSLKDYQYAGGKAYGQKWSIIVANHIYDEDYDYHEKDVLKLWNDVSKKFKISFEEMKEYGESFGYRILI